MSQISIFDEIEYLERMTWAERWRSIRPLIPTLFCFLCVVPCLIGLLYCVVGFRFCITSDKGMCLGLSVTSWVLLLFCFGGTMIAFMIAGLRCLYRQIQKESKISTSLPQEIS